MAARRKPLWDASWKLDRTTSGVLARQQMKPPVASFRVIKQSATAGDPLHFVSQSQGYMKPGNGVWGCLRFWQRQTG